MKSISLLLLLVTSTAAAQDISTMVKMRDGKRLCVDTGYFATFNRPNVSLVDVRSEPIEAITRTGLRQGGRDFELDAIVFYDSPHLTFDRALRCSYIIGKALAEKWPNNEDWVQACGSREVLDLVDEFGEMIQARMGTIC